MTTPLKLGFAVACLVGVAALIAKDQWNSDRRDAGVVASETGKSEATVAPPAIALIPPVSGQPGVAVICPQVPSSAADGIPGSDAKNASAGKQAEASPRPAGEKAQTSPSAADATPRLKIAAPEPPSEGKGLYTVLQGDTLYGISVKVFGTPRHYERIYEANRDRIRDPNTLQVGINLRMPEVSPKAGSGVSGTTSQLPSPGRADSTSAPSGDGNQAPR
jgi:nucleoid-associated protein YgaU